MSRAQPKKEATIRCKVASGMFSDERSVVVELPGKHIVTFVDRSDVVVSRDPKPGEQLEGRVRVAVLEVNRSSALVDLPQPAVTQGTRLRIPKTMLE